MLKRFKSLKLCLLLAYALAMQGMAIASAATSLQADSPHTAWCLPGQVIKAAPSSGDTAPSSSHDGQCCFNACAGAAALASNTGALPVWPRVTAEKPNARSFDVSASDPAHPWSPRGPPTV